MTIEEKLRHFLDSTLNISKAQSEQIIQDYTNELEADFAEKKENIDNTSGARLKLEQERIVKESNHQLASRVILIKKENGEVHDQLKTKLFTEVRTLLAEYRKTDDYIDYLVTHFQAAIDFAGDDTEILYLDPDDVALRPIVEKRLGRTVTVSEYSFGGGCRTVLSEPQILIDDSFDSALEDRQKEFTFNGGRQHD